MGSIRRLMDSIKRLMCRIERIYVHYREIFKRERERALHPALLMGISSSCGILLGLVNYTGGDLFLVITIIIIDDI